jgi:class 3 adenylate cyclase
MIRRSAELEAIVRRWTDLIRSHKTTDLPHFLSHDEALTYLGTSDGELWKGKLVRDGISDHMAEVPDFSEEDVDIEAWENGDTGWATYRSRFRFHATGTEGVHRVTFVFVMERGSWKIINHHISQADSNIEKMGVEHEAFSALIKAARDGFHLDQSEGMVTVMFTDVVGSSALAELMGDRAWVTRMSDHFSQVRQQVEAAGGQFVKSLGDGTMSCFRTARSALEAAARIQADMGQQTTEPLLQVRIGLHTGDVIQTKDDFFGTVVNTAARIGAVATPGGIFLSEVTRLMVGGDGIVFSDPIVTRLKGLTGEHRLYQMT